MAKKTSKGLVVLSSGLICAVYLLGYEVTQQATVQAQAQKALTQALCGSSGASVQSTVGAQKQGEYRDGTFCGIGNSPYGDVQVAIKIQRNRIQHVIITQVTTYFPESWIDGLPAQVSARQSADIDIVTGATGSSDAFQQAVENALNLAKGKPDA